MMDTRRDTRQLLLGIHEIEGQEKWTRAGVMRVVKALFAVSWLGMNGFRIYTTNQIDLIGNSVVQGLVLSTFLLTYGYYKAKPNVLELVKKEGFLIEKGELE